MPCIVERTLVLNPKEAIGPDMFVALQSCSGTGDVLTVDLALYTGLVRDSMWLTAM